VAGNNIDSKRVNNVAIETAQITGVSIDSTQLALTDTLLQTANQTGADQALRSLTNLKAL
jgi:hypothetical protein